jgi:hypothetical protein
LRSRGCQNRHPRDDSKLIGRFRRSTRSALGVENCRLPRSALWKRARVRSWRLADLSGSAF